mmetsp:Transcript_18603/g.43000  ORF Transcript_18603/g.43000 Transcript_18603/m.43000 type:complete len:302 (-) Transcript_18603:819-1724(-)
MPEDRLDRGPLGPADHEADPPPRRRYRRWWRLGGSRGEASVERRRRGTSRGGCLGVGTRLASRRGGIGPGTIAAFDGPREIDGSHRRVATKSDEQPDRRSEQARGSSGTRLLVRAATFTGRRRRNGRSDREADGKAGEDRDLAVRSAALADPGRFEQRATDGRGTRVLIFAAAASQEPRSAQQDAAADRYRLLVRSASSEPPASVRTEITGTCLLGCIATGQTPRRRSTTLDVVVVVALRVVAGVLVRSSRDVSHSKEQRRVHPHPPASVDAHPGLDLIKPAYAAEPAAALERRIESSSKR